MEDNKKEDIPEMEENMAAEQSLNNIEPAEIGEEADVAETTEADVAETVEIEDADAEAEDQADDVQPVQPAQSNTLRYIIQIFAGAYLFYISYSQIKGLLAGETDNPTLFWVFAVVFIVFGIFFVFLGAKGLIDDQKKKGD